MVHEIREESRRPAKELASFSVYRKGCSRHTWSKTSIFCISGQLAAYKAYRKYVDEQRHGVEEDVLPGLEQYTPNQIFWIAYGYSWCMKRTDNNMRRQVRLFRKMK